ncbi:MAG: DUF4269 domain-containing protein [Alphaproteobacteria bacterium]|jgi:hypothetical protein
MMENFLDPAYLATGNDRQRAAHGVLSELRLFQVLASYQAMLSGTIPLAIDIEGSDLDVLCEVHDFDRFAKALQAAYSHEENFKQSDFKPGRDGPYRTASFSHGGFVIEVFAQSLPVTRQGAYRHMLIQARLLDLGGEALRRDIIALRRSGLKTEPAFARRLDMDGDPYVALFALEEMDDDGLRRLLDNTPETHRC